MNNVIICVVVLLFRTADTVSGRFLSSFKSVMMLPKMIPGSRKPDFHYIVLSSGGFKIEDSVAYAGFAMLNPPTPSAVERARSAGHPSVPPGRSKRPAGMMDAA